MRMIGELAARVAAIVLICGLVCACLIRYTPGASVDERELDYRLDTATIAHLRSERDAGARLGRYLAGLARGDLGYSESNGAPVSALIRDRGPQTLRELGAGLGAGWVIGVLLAIPGVRKPGGAWGYEMGSSLAAGLLMSLPAALLAYLCVMVGAAPAAVVALALAPKVFRFTRNTLGQAYAATHVAVARARGVGEARILLAHAGPAAMPQLAALAGASVSMAIGAAIPVEAICGNPGLGRLAWNAATSRDLPLLVNLTMLAALVVSVASAIPEAAARRRGAAA